MAARDGQGDVEDDGRAAAAVIREEIARRRMSRQALADAARISISTLEKGLSARRPFTLATLVRIEDALGVSLRLRRGTAGQDTVAVGAAAPDNLGSYNRAAVVWLEGSYLTLRPSFGDREAVYAYRTDIAWEGRSSRLVFRENERVDKEFTQFGEVAVPHQSGHVYLVTNRHGQHRLIVLARPTITGAMHGLLMTLIAGRGSHLSPVSAPIVLQLLKPGDTPAFGRIPQGHAAFARYRALLRKTVDDHFATLLPVP